MSAIIETPPIRRGCPCPPFAYTSTTRPPTNGEPDIEALPQKRHNELGRRSKVYGCFLGNRHWHIRHQISGYRRKRQNPGRGNRNLRVVFSQAAVERAGPGGLVASHCEYRSRDGEEGQGQTGRCPRDRPVGTDARLGVSRQAEPCD